MKKESKAMPKSINSQKNEQLHTGVAQAKVNTSKCNIAPTEEYLRNGLRLMDGRYECVVENMVFDPEIVASLLYSGILLFNDISGFRDDLHTQTRAVLDLASAYYVYCSIKDILNPDSPNDTLEGFRQHDEELYHLLKDEDRVSQLVEINREEFEFPENPKFWFGNESIDMETLSDLIEWGFRMLTVGLSDKEEYEEFSSTVFEGCIMVTQLRRMGSKDAIRYIIDELGTYSKDCIEYLFGMETIEKEEVAN